MSSEGWAALSPKCWPTRIGKTFADSAHGSIWQTGIRERLYFPIFRPDLDEIAQAALELIGHDKADEMRGQQKFASPDLDNIWAGEKAGKANDSIYR